MRQKLVEWIMKISNVSESPIARDNLLSMRQLHNEIIASLDHGGLIGVRHANTHYVIISDTMFHSLEPTKLRPMIDNEKIMCGCAIFNTSKHF